MIERAKGIIMKQRGVERRRSLPRAALARDAERGIKLGEVARQVIDVAGLLG